MITRTITIEDLIEDYPKSVKYLADKGIRCIKCGEPIWGTLEEACLEKDFSQESIDVVISELIEIHNLETTEDAIEMVKISNIKKIDNN